MAAFRRAAALPGAGPPTWVELASLCEQAHHLDEAESLLERAVRAGYDAPQVELVRGRVARRRGQMDVAEGAFESLVARFGDVAQWAGPRGARSH